jgi:hypothetical protein
MLIETKLALDFERDHVQEALICEMARRCPSVVFNIDALSVGQVEAAMTIGLVGEPPDVRAAEEYFKSLNVGVRTISSDRFKGTMPTVPVRAGRADTNQPTVQRKIWLTIIGSRRRQPYLWVLSRRFGVTYSLMQSTTGEPVSIVSLLMAGPKAEVDGAIAYLRDQGIGVEYGEVPESLGYTPSA